VHAQVRLRAALGLLLLAHVRLVLVVDEVDDRCPRVPVVDVVAEAGGVDDGELDLELLLLELGLDDVDLGELVELLDVPARVVLRRGELGREERVDERRLAEPGLACGWGSVGCGAVGKGYRKHAPTTMRVKCVPFLATIL
jgi:hypothetical protein